MNRRGRIGGSPIQEEASMPSPQKPDGFPFDIAELQTAEQPPQMNKGGVLKAYTGVATVDQSGSGQTYTPKLDNKASEQYFGTSTAGARLIRYVAEGCKQKSVLAQADRIPIASGASEGGYFDITSDAGLDIVAKCSEIFLNSGEEQTVIDRIGQQPYDDWKGGETRTGDDEPVEEAKPTVTATDDKDAFGEVNQKDFIQNYDINQLANYADDVAKYYGNEDGVEDGFFSGLIKGVVSPIIKLNHKHLVARTAKILMNGGYTDVNTNQFVPVDTTRDPVTGDYTDPTTLKIASILTSNPGGMKEGERYKVGGVIYEFRGGKHVIYDPLKKIAPTISNPNAIRPPSGVSGDDPYEMEEDNDYIDLSFKTLDDKYDITNPGLMTTSLDPTQTTRQQYENYVLDSQAGETDLTTRSEMERGTQAISSGDTINVIPDDGIDAGEIGSDKKPFWAVPISVNDDDDDDDDNYPSTPTVATNFASGLMNEKDDGASLDVEAKQYNKAQADLSDAYGGGEAAEKFKIFNKGGLVKKKKRATKKK